MSFSSAPLMVLAAALCCASTTLSCSQDPPRSPAILRPLDEPHAVAIMARVFREFGLDPVRNRVVKFGADQADLRLDVAARDRRFGVAYITWQDVDKLGDHLPKRRDPSGILVVRGNGDDDDVHAVLFFAADYMQDDLAGDAHTATSVAAEKKLETATRDVLRRAAQETWP